MNMDKVRELYVDQHLSIRNVAALLGVGKEPLRQAMIRAGIRRRTKSEAQLGEYNPVYKPSGHTFVHKGYVMVKRPEHHLANAKGFVPEHVLMAEQKLGRPLRRGEHVHHMDRNRANNAPENLMVFASHEEHMRWHAEHDGDWLFKKGIAPHNKGVITCPRRSKQTS